MLDTNIPMRMKNFFSVIQRTYQRQSASSNKGVSILLTVLIMSVILAIGLGLSIILIQQTKMMVGIGNSVVAFYAADSGIEKSLYDILKKGGTGNVSENWGLNYGYQVTVTPCGSKSCVKSIGTYRETKRAIEVEY